MAGFCPALLSPGGSRSADAPCKHASRNSVTAVSIHARPKGQMPSKNATWPPLLMHTLKALAEGSRHAVKIRQGSPQAGFQNFVTLVFTHARCPNSPNPLPCIVCEAHRSWYSHTQIRPGAQHSETSCNRL